MYFWLCFYLSIISGTAHIIVGFRTLASPLYPFLTLVDISVMVFGEEYPTYSKNKKRVIKYSQIDGFITLLLLICTLLWILPTLIPNNIMVFSESSSSTWASGRYAMYVSSGFGLSINIMHFMVATKFRWVKTTPCKHLKIIYKY